MFSCKYCEHTSNWSSNLSKPENAMHMNKMNQDFGFQNSNVRAQNGMFSCKYCTYTSNWSSNLQKHEKAKHNGHHGEIELSSSMPNKSHFGSGYNVANIHGVFDIRLKENFKLFGTGPSRCGKTVFVAKLLENIHAFAKLPPTKVVYVYKVWQPKYDEIM